jgi:PAS domain S-box-containing protein
MGPAERVRRKFVSSRITAFGWRISAALFSLASLICAVTLLAARLRNFDLFSLLLGIALATLCAVAFFLSRFLLEAREQERHAVRALDDTEASLSESEERFRQMADNIQEVFWMIDAETRKTLYVNPAYETITGRSRASLKHDPLSYKEVIHPEDRARVLLKLDEATRTGELDERFRIIALNGEVRWVWARGSAVHDDKARIRRLVGTVLDITTQKQAEDDVVKHLATAESAWSEADAMRRATLALTQDLRLDTVLDTLLQCLLELVPYEAAHVLLVESDTRLFLAREAPRLSAELVGSYPFTFDCTAFPLLESVLFNQSAVVVKDTRQVREWRPLRGMGQVRSWLCVPLIASHHNLGMLSLGHSAAERFTQEHLRVTKSLSVPAAAAIQNARLYECAQIFGRELEKSTSGLQRAQSSSRRWQGGQS